MELSVSFKPVRVLLPLVTGNESEHGVTFKLWCLLLKSAVIYLVVAIVTRLWIPVCTIVNRRPGST